MSQTGIAVALTSLAAVMLAGTVHIASLLAMPGVAPNDAFSRLSLLAPWGKLTILPRASAPGDPLPDRDPSVATAICRYDLAQGPLRVSAGLGSGAFVALSLHGRSGVAYYALNDRAGNDGQLDLVIMTQDQSDAAATRYGQEPLVREVRVLAPEHQGFVSFDVLPRIGGYAEALRDLASMRCGVEHPL